MRSFIDATVIQQYLASSRRDGQELLPQLVDKLITASIPRDKIKRNRIPHGDQIGLTGPDGILIIEGESNNQFIPSGISLWEFGTSNDPKSKADSDFDNAVKKLTDAFPGIAPAITPEKASFVFVTSKPWDSTQWKKEKAQSSQWNNILIYDATDLEKWLEQCPTIMLWFAEVCGLPAEGLYDAEQYIKKQGIQFGVSLSPELIIAGRDKSKEAICNLLIQSNQSFSIKGESVEEAASFLAATSLIEKDTTSKIPPMVFADGQANLNLLATFNNELIIFPLDSEAFAKVKQLSQTGWRIVTPCIINDELKAKENGTILGQCDRNSLEQYLIQYMDITEHKARQIARNSKGSLVAFLWMVGSGPIAIPRWATRKDATTHASLILAGSWVGNNENDIEIIEKLSRKEYRDIETLLQSALLPDGPWIHQGIEWLCASKDFVWSQLAQKITETMLQDFHDTISDAVGEINPSLELKPSERYMAQILGKVRKYSSSLRKGLVDSLARLAIARSDGQGWADKIVGSLLDPNHSDADKRWISLVDVYSELAEASPDVFLKSLNSLLKLTPKLFFPDASDENDVFGPTSAHVYLLWALERLAWQHEYFSRVLIILAKLAENAPENISGNNPHNSLVEILLPWHPQHNEKMRNAAKALETIYQVSPDIAWSVAVKLLPSSHGFASPNPKPEYRSNVKEPEITVNEYWNFILAIVEKMVLWANSNPKRLSELVEAYPDIQKGWDKLGEMVTKLLNETNIDEWDDNDKIIVKDSLDELITRHKEFDEVDWALPEEILSRLDKIRDKYTPSDIILRWRPYFSYEPNDPEGPQKRYDDEWDKWLDEKRKQAVIEIYEQKGLPGLLRLSNKTTLPEYVGQAVACLSLKENEIAELLEKTLSISPGLYQGNSLLQFGRGFAFIHFRQAQDDWIEKVLLLTIAWSPEIYANLVLTASPSPELWKKLDGWGEMAKQLYWENIEVRSDIFNYWEMVVEEWQKVNRPFSMIELLARLVDDLQKDKDVKKPSTEQVMDALELALEADDEIEAGRQKGQMLRYYTEKLFTYLDTQKADSNRLAGLEWSYLRLLENTKRGVKVLHQQLTTSAEMFLSILKLIYKSKDESLSETPDKKREVLANQAFHLLRGIKTIPGLQKTEEGINIDAVSLHAWVKESRELAKEADILDVCDSRIGEILSLSPESPDGTWPCVEVRDVLEEIQSESIESGFRVGKYNQRGVVFRGKDGKQEWNISRKYKNYADIVRAKWPYTATILDDLASTYEHEAKDWDKRAKWEEYD